MSRRSPFFLLLLLSLLLIFSAPLSSSKLAPKSSTAPKIQFIPLALETPFTLKSTLDPLKPQYFFVNVSGVNYNALSVSLLCNQDSSTGCVTTTQINITTTPVQMEQFQSTWSKKENTSYPGELITATSNPPFKPAVYFISVMTFSQNISNAAILAQAYSGGDIRIKSTPPQPTTRVHRHVIESDETTFALPIPYSNAQREEEEETIDLIPMVFSSTPTTLFNAHNVVSLNAYVKHGYFGKKMQSVRPIIAPQSDYFDANGKDYSGQKYYFFETTKFFGGSFVTKKQERILLVKRTNLLSNHVQYEPYIVFIRPKESLVSKLATRFLSLFNRLPFIGSQ